MKKIIGCFIFIHISVFSQTICLFDENKISVNNAAIYIKYLESENEQFIYSDKNGCFDIESPPPFAFLIKHINFINYIDTINNPISDTISIQLNKSVSPISEVVVTAQIFDKKIYESVYNIELINKEKINSSASNHLNDILSQSSLFNINYDPVLGSSLNIQGVQGNNVNILIDGSPVIGRKGSQIDLGQLSLSNISRVEVLKGPASVSYGTNSTGGVINLITDRNNFEDNLNLSIYRESIGVKQYVLNADKSSQNSLYNFNYGTYNFEGFGSDSLRSTYWNSKEQNFGEFNFHHNYGKTDLKFKSRFFNEQIIDKGNENFKPFDGTATDMYYNTNRVLNLIRFNHLDSNFTISTSLSLSQTLFSKNQFEVNLINFELTETDNENYNSEDLFKTIYGRFEYSYIGNKYESQFGFDLFDEFVSGSKIINDTAQIQRFEIFSKIEFDLFKKIKTQMGIRIPYHSIYSAPITPSIHFNYVSSPSFQLRSSYARGYRSPTIKELFMEFIDFNHYIYGNQDLLAEYSHSFLSSVSYNMSKNNVFFLKFDLELFYNLLENKIQLVEVENSNIFSPIQPYIYYNLSKSVYYGSYFNLNTTILKNQTFNFSFNNYYIDSYEFEDEIHRRSLSINYILNHSKINGGFNFSYKLRFKSKYQRLEDEVLVSYNVDDYQIFNANFFKNFPDKGVEFGVGIKNILNVKQIDYYSNEDPHSDSSQIISWGRTWYFKFKYNMF